VNLPLVLRRRLEEILTGDDSVDVTWAASARDCGDADVVLAVAGDPRETAVAREFLYTSNAQRVALMAASGREMVVYELTDVPVPVADVSVSGMVALLCKGLVPG